MNLKVKNKEIKKNQGTTTLLKITNPRVMTSSVEELD